ncbi:MAG TPA: hypothetical protein VIZ69_06895 [Thermoanaerobaculia bacterium]
MKRSLRIGLATAALGIGLAFVRPSAAHAQVSFFGRFPLPHGSLSIGVGSPVYPVGSYVPYGYADRIEYLPDYGYGFYCDTGEWIPVQQYGTQWIVIQRPVVRGYAVRPFRSYSYRDDGYRRFSRDDRRFDRNDRNDRRFDRRFENRRYR